MRRYLLLTVLVLLLAACSGFRDASHTATINVPVPPGQAAQLTLHFGAAEHFQLAAGATALIEGRVQYNDDQLQPRIMTSGSRVTIAQAVRSTILPSSDLGNAWDLKLSGAIPLQLTVEAGAYTGSYDLGGLRLRALTVTQGAAQTSYDFSAPNTEPMEQLSVTSGVSELRMAHLANANAATMRFALAAGSNTLDFGGSLLRNARVAITSGAGDLILRVPKTTPMRVNVTGALNDVQSSGFDHGDGPHYINAAWNDVRPHIEVSIDGAVGAIHLESV